VPTASTVLIPRRRPREGLHQPDRRGPVLSSGIYLIEDIFGRTLTNSDGKEVFVRDIAEQHVLEDVGFIPSLSDWLKEMPSQPWMAGARKRPVQIVD
jgi:hypothetical protein